MKLLRSFPKLSQTGTSDYGWGFWCDRCHKEVPALVKSARRGRKPRDFDERIDAPGENTLFYHCQCGYDLCKECGASIISAKHTEEHYSIELKSLVASFPTPSPLRKTKIYNEQERFVKSTKRSSGDMTFSTPGESVPKSTSNQKRLVEPFPKPSSKIVSTKAVKVTTADEKAMLSNAGWICHYEVFQDEESIYMLYMCGSSAFGCIVMNRQSDFQSVVLYNAKRKLVFYGPQLDPCETKRKKKATHSSVQTVYGDRLLKFSENEISKESGHRKFPELPRYLTVVKNYSSRLDGADLPYEPVETLSVPYMRGFFFDYNHDGDPEWYLFHLSNGHTMLSLVASNSQVRWLSPNPFPRAKRQTSSKKYLVQDGKLLSYNDHEYLAKVRKTLQDWQTSDHLDI